MEVEEKIVNEQYGGLEQERRQDIRKNKRESEGKIREINRKGRKREISN